MSYIINAYNRLEIPIVKGKGVFLFDQVGKKYLDFTAGISTVSLGHCHPYIIEKLNEQLDLVWHCSNLFTIPTQELLAERLCSLTFADKVFFCSSGLEATEAVIKFIRRYFYSKGEKNRHQIITIKGGFHGRSIAAISAGGNEKARTGFAPLLPGFCSVPRNCIQALENKINKNVAAVFLEPIQSEGGVYQLDIDYLRRVREITREKEIILCFDEVQCGYGRIGTLFYYQKIGVEPDMLTAAKAMGNGFPLAACLVKNYIADTILPGTHGSTYGGNPLAMAAGNAVLDLMLEENLFKHVIEISSYFKKKLLLLIKEFPQIIVDVRGEGLLLGIEVSISAKSIVQKCLDKGLILSAVLDDRVIRITPPLIISEDHIDAAFSILYNSLQYLNKD
ncbi:aspartate aminotransferase family protein [Wolbachia endosymbiont of Pentidionis agamae]|uniref:aspartate aminotransferase family protein n=1 Tax=Wolbachia endosymbiont of Pentidionis agamae TaxID=3110435 RepID=UPI002FD58786